MTILCTGDTHVFQAGSDACDCGLYPSEYWGSVTTGLTKPYPSIGGVIPGYTPNSYTPQQPHTPPVAGQAPDVPLILFRAALDVKATHLSSDGLIAYDERKYGVWRCFWDKETKKFGTWFKMFEELPKDAVKT